VFAELYDKMTPSTIQHIVSYRKTSDIADDVVF